MGLTQVTITRSHVLSPLTAIFLIFSVLIDAGAV